MQPERRRPPRQPDAKRNAPHLASFPGVVTDSDNSQLCLAASVVQATCEQQTLGTLLAADLRKRIATGRFVRFTSPQPMFI